MARRKKRGIEISLFPFLSILACVIGVLTLMITGIVLASYFSVADEMLETAVNVKR